MAVFYFLILVPILIQHSKIKGISINYERKNKLAMAFFFFFLTLLIILRHEKVGNDTIVYIDHFKRFSRTDWGNLWTSEGEYIFPYLNKLISVFSKEPHFFLAVVAIIVTAMIWPTYRRLCEDTALTISLFCIMSTFVMMFSGIKQMLATGIGCIAYDFVRKRKLLPFFLAVLMAMSFHTSAFMLAFMYPLYYARITKKWLYVLVPVLAVCFVFNQQIFGALALILQQYTSYETEIESTGAYTMLILFVLLTVFSFLIPDEKKLNEETVGLRNYLVLTMVLQMFAPLHTLAMRMSYYYMIFVPLLLPKIIKVRSKRWNQVAILGRYVMVVFFLIYFFLIKVNDGGNLNVFPYHFFWESV